ncbi:helix-turn-helix domain-containing protein [Bacillus altitudinis]|uniref:helix-turn-helix domain-containing protein n=1 Tax=Bacillus altitudinis TaxID=293387 RepID=UPI00210133E3|nr:transcriptional regulator [Bacillus altitudinis]UTV31696.1 transcriptional regulator [Bacillus altitudinis]
MESHTKIIAKGNIDDKFAKMPVELYDYIQLDLISHSDVIIYMRLYDLSNDKLGYAYPTIPQLMVSTRIGSKTTIHRSIKKLVGVGLIEKEKTRWGNNKYFVYKPLSREELNKRYPDKAKDFIEFEAKIMNIAENDKERFQQHQQEKQEQTDIHAKQIVPMSEILNKETYQNSD